MGKVVLIRSVCYAVLAFFMQCLPLHKGTCDEIDRTLRSFLWEALGGKQKMHLISWDTITLPTDQGGLGLFKSYNCNLAFLGKLYWRMTQNQRSPWAIICSQSLKNKSKFSIVHKCLSKGKLVVDLGAKSIIHSGLQTSLWNDHWLPQGPLINIIAGPLLPHEFELKVAHVLDAAGNWLWDAFSYHLPPHIVQSMISLPRNPLGNRDDIISWEPNSNGIFTVKSAYHVLCRKNPPPIPSSKWLWNIPCHPRLRFFCWLLWHQALPTNFLLSKRGISISPFCVLCGSHDESIEHLFRYCSASQYFWTSCSNPPNVFISSSLNFGDWIKSCIRCQDASIYNIPFGTLFLYCLWSIWLARNKKAYQCAPFHPTATFKDALNHAVEFFFLGISHKTPTAQPHTILVKWTPPEQSLIKVNVDGACDPKSGSIAAGGLIRNHLGLWVQGFQKFLGRGDSFLAEVWGALLGIQLASSLNFSNLWIESDCSQLVFFLNNCNSYSFHHCAPLLNLCRSYLSHFENIKITHVLREGNQCADALAKDALVSHCNLISSSSCPSFVSALYTADCLGLHTPRGIG